MSAFKCTSQNFCHCCIFWYFLLGGVAVCSVYNDTKTTCLGFLLYKGIVKLLILAAVFRLFKNGKNGSPLFIFLSDLANKALTQLFLLVIDLGGEPINASEYDGLARVMEFVNGMERMFCFRNWGDGCGFIPSDRAVVFVDNRDNQRSHGAGGASVGPSEFGFKMNMVTFHNVVNGQSLSNWWDNSNNQIAYSCGSKGALNVTLNTGLPKGTYCDVISGDKSGGSCTGKEVLVDADGRATFSISNTDEDPFIAIHADSKL
uniref:Alpha-amylase C-terminal domain-containing protein n=2 Tax=Cyprinus carpio TaxID=7962 RepID=A0A9J7YNF5_CYPCA